MDENFAMGYAMGQDNGNGNNDLFGGGTGGWLGILLLIALLGGGFGFGGFGGFGGGAGLQGMATRADINEGFALNNITSGIQAIQQGICDSTYALNNAIQGGFNATQMGMMQGFNGVERGFCDLSHQISDCCCTTQRAIDGVNYNMATQTNALQQAMCTSTRDIIDSQQAGTRAILDFLTQDKISTLTAENQALKFAASQAQQNAFITANQDAQTAELIRRLGRDCPVPAYVVPNPNCCYGNPLGVGYGYNQNACGCA
jgi:hypothetical protein